MDRAVIRNKKIFKPWITLFVMTIYAILMFAYQTNIAEFKDVKNINDAVSFLFDHTSNAFIVVGAGIVLHLIVAFSIVISLIGLLGLLTGYCELNEIILVVIDLILALILLGINLYFVKSFAWILLVMIIVMVVGYVLANDK